jgi:putative salt-induced outer membrane protein
VNKTPSLIAALLIGAGTLHSEEPTKKWKNATEASVVSANGNSRTQSTSVKNTFGYEWSKETTFELIGQALGASSESDVTAENYLVSEKVTLKLVEKTYIYEKFAWDKDRFAGIANRYDASVGLGRILLDLAKDKLKMELGGGYVNEERTEASRNDFASGRAYGQYEHLFSETAKFTQDGEYLHNFDNSKAYRLKTETALIASITTHVSLKTSFQWKRNAVPPPNTVKDDTLTAAALIINY